MMRRVLFLAGRVAGATKEERQLNLGVGGGGGLIIDCLWIYCNQSGADGMWCI